MALRVYSILLAFVLQGLALGQSSGPNRSNKTAQRTPPERKNLDELSGELQRLITSRDTISQKIDRLRKITGQHQQILVHVRVCELSLTQLGRKKVRVAGVDPKHFRTTGFREALGAGAFEQPMRPAEAAFSGSKRGTLGFHILENDDTFNVAVESLRQAGALKVLAEPTVATISGHQASFRSGGKLPLPRITPAGDSAIEFLRFGTELDVLPTIVGKDTVRLEVRPQVTELESEGEILVSGVKIPRLRTRFVDTAAELRFGQTLVLAGMTQQRKHPGQNVTSTSKDTTTKGKRPSLDGERSDVGTPTDRAKLEELELIVVVRPELVDIARVAHRNDGN